MEARFFEFLVYWSGVTTLSVMCLWAIHDHVKARPDFLESSIALNAVVDEAALQSRLLFYEKRWNEPDEEPYDGAPEEDLDDGIEDEPATTPATPPSKMRPVYYPPDAVVPV